MIYAISFITNTNPIQYLSHNNYPIVKIGYSKALTQRIRSFQQAIPLQLVVLGFMQGSLSDEKHMHRQLERHRFQREWYYYTPDLIHFLKRRFSFELYNLYDSNKIPQDSSRNQGESLWQRMLNIFKK